MKNISVPLLVGFFILLASSFVLAQEKTTAKLVMGKGDWPPYRFSSPEGDGKYQGLFVDLITRLFDEELGIVIERYPLPWKRAQDAVKAGDADFMITIPTPERLEYVVATDLPLYRMNLHLYTYADHPKRDAIAQIQTVEDIKRLDLELAAHIGDGWYKTNVASKGVRSHYLSVDEDLVRFVGAKRADGMIDILLPTNRKIREGKLQSKVVLTDIKFGPIDFYVLIGKKSPLIERIDDINAVMQRMIDDGFVDAIEAKYDQ